MLSAVKDIEKAITVLPIDQRIGITFLDEGKRLKIKPSAGDDLSRKKGQLTNVN